MSADRLSGLLERRSPGAWELYRKVSDARETDLTRSERREAFRRENGWAARWWDRGLRFACASDPERLAAAVAEASRLPARAEAPPRLPGSKGERPAPDGDRPLPPDVFERLGQLVAEKSRGEAVLASLALRSGRAEERIVNGAGLSVSTGVARRDGVARAVGRRDSKGCETRAVFRWDGEPDLESLAGRLADGATFPLAPRGVTFARGAWLLDPGVAAAVLAAIAPLFCADTLPRWVKKSDFAARRVRIADDASADAPFDGEGTPTRRVLVVEDGALAARLHDLRSAARAAELPTGHGVRPSYRDLPRPGPRRLFLETSQGSSPRELLGSVGRGVFARALTAPVSVDLALDRYDVQFTGVSILAGRATEPVAGARVRGRVSELLSRFGAIGTDLQFFPMPYPAGAPTVLIEKVTFE
ncbi:MAG TPA: metallopeptidase TldD-related protein [Thermoanaerobaculia bacterium]|nr:metallopeptidase TldD-related protein [Thermoanaerobaculia bacterium]